MFKRLLLSLLFIAVMINAVILVTDRTYLYRALIYQNPGIDDLAIFPSREIPAADTPKPWLKAPDYNRRPIPLRLQKVLEHFKTTQFVVLQNGRLSFEKYWLGATAETRSNSFSVAKSIVSVLIGVAMSEGRIHSLDDKVAKYLPAFDTPSKRAITIRDVLRMASGLSFLEDTSGPISDTAEAYYGTDLAKLVNRLTVVEEPGTLWRYRSGDTLVLGMVLTAATGRRISEYAAEKLWQPLGATKPGAWNLDREQGQEKAFCCFYANARNFARLGELYRLGGQFSGQQIVNADFARQSITANRLIDDSGTSVNWYGYQWWVYDRNGINAFYARGMLGQYIIVIPDHELVVVRLGQQRGKEVKHHPQDVIEIIHGVVKMYSKS